MANVDLSQMSMEQLMEGRRQAMLAEMSIDQLMELKQQNSTAGLATDATTSAGLGVSTTTPAAGLTAQQPTTPMGEQPAPMQQSQQDYNLIRQKERMLAVRNPELYEVYQQSKSAGVDKLKEQAGLLGSLATNLIQVDDPRTQLNMLHRYKQDFEMAGRTTYVIEQGIKQLESGESEKFKANLQKLIQSGQTLQPTGRSEDFPKQVGTDPKTGKPILQNVRAIVYGNGQVKEVPFGPTFIGQENNPLITARVARAEAEAGAKVKGATEEKARLSPLIAQTQSKIEFAKARAKEQGKDLSEAIISYEDQIANFPNIDGMVISLLDLAPNVTSSLAGKAFDALAKQTGFGATKGATARAKYNAIVNGNLLPLLKATFGGSPSNEEYERLVATVGDIDLEPEAKKAALSAFIEQRARSIQLQQRKLNKAPTPIQNIISPQLMTTLGIKEDDVTAPTPAPTPTTTPPPTPAPTAPALKEGAIAVNPQTGERVQLINGQWSIIQ